MGEDKASRALAAAIRRRPENFFKIGELSLRLEKEIFSSLPAGKGNPREILKKCDCPRVFARAVEKERLSLPERSSGAEFVSLDAEAELLGPRFSRNQPLTFLCAAVFGGKRRAERQSPEILQSRGTLEDRRRGGPA